MTNRQIAFVVACTVAIILVVAAILGTPKYVVPVGTHPGVTVGPMTPEEEWGK